jgi:gamma-glutamyl hydrolase
MKAISLLLLSIVGILAHKQNKQP